ncbi:MAG: hypothetical protein H6721_32220 [Sandaracinus sp.]|nr:hypothetical protein [Sandaracinus sp.]
MRWVSSIRFTALVLGAWLVLAGSSADAQRRARTLTREAVSEFDRGNYAEARALFLEAHDDQPSARLLRGAGMASFELREYVVAYRQLRQALDEERRALTPRQRRETEDLLARTESFLGRFRLRIEPSDAEVTIDLRAPQLEEDGTILLSVGDHTIAARAEGFVPVDRRFSVRGGELEDLTVLLSRDEPENADALVSPTPPPPPVETPHGLDRLGIGLVSAGGALVAGAVGNLVWWLGRRSELGQCEDAEEMPGARCLNLGTLRRQSRAAGATTFLVGLAGLAMGTMGILRLTWDDAGPEHEVACGPGGCRYRLRF